VGSNLSRSTLRSLWPTSDKPKFCCHVAQNLFVARNEVGEFLVAGENPVQFYAGFNAAHHKDYSDVFRANRTLAAACEAAGISNLKLTSHHITCYCSHCGTKLVKYYGKAGGALRDDKYVADMLTGFP
jgi:hypothetical protein